MFQSPPIAKDVRALTITLRRLNILSDKQELAWATAYVCGDLDFLNTRQFWRDYYLRRWTET